MLVLCVLLVLVGGLAWWFQLQPPLAVDPAPLMRLPKEVGSWQAEDVPLEATVEAELRADANLQRVYRHPAGALIWLYVGYYGTNRGGRPEHTPRGCYIGAGYGIEATRQIDVDPETGLRVNEYVVEREGQRHLVHFWYRSHRRTGILGGLDQNVDRIVGRLVDGRADGALIRLSTPLRDDDETSARGRLLSFAQQFDPVLGRHWPDEKQTSL